MKGNLDMDVLSVGARRVFGSRTTYLEGARTWDTMRDHKASARWRWNAWRAGQQILGNIEGRCPDYATQGSPLVTR